jgi:hypothetical protein
MCWSEASGTPPPLENYCEEGILLDVWRLECSSAVCVHSMCRFHTCFGAGPASRTALRPLCSWVVVVVWALRGVGVLGLCRIAWLAHCRSSAQAAVSSLSHLTNRQRALLGLPAVPDAPSVPLHTPGLDADGAPSSSSRPPSGRINSGGGGLLSAAGGSNVGTPSLPRRSDMHTPHREGPGSGTGSVTMSPYSPYTPPSGIGQGTGSHSAVSLLRARQLGLDSPSGANGEGGSSPPPPPLPPSLPLAAPYCPLCSLTLIIAVLVVAWAATTVVGDAYEIDGSDDVGAEAYVGGAAAKDTGYG